MKNIPRGYDWDCIFDESLIAKLRYSAQKSMLSKSVERQRIQTALTRQRRKGKKRQEAAAEERKVKRQEREQWQRRVAGQQYSADGSSLSTFLDPFSMRTKRRRTRLLHEPQSASGISRGTQSAHFCCPFLLRRNRMMQRRKGTGWRKAMLRFHPNNFEGPNDEVRS